MFSRMQTIASAALLGLALSAGAAAAQAEPDYLTTHAAKAGVVVMPGLHYEILASGPVDGPHPKMSDQITVHYEGRLVSGEVFDSSFEKEPVTFPLRGLIPGWVSALRLMRPGDEWLLTLPPELAYGARGVGPIPPDAVLIFRIRLLSVTPPAEAPK